MTSPDPPTASSPAPRRAELADFLRSRRLRLDPETVGLPQGGRRRTPGLRREEVAMLAQTSTTWYTWLEQQRDIRVSAPLLDRLADALRLDPGERAHLFALSGQPAPIRDVPREDVPPAVQRFIQGLHDRPASVLGRRWDYVAWNRAAEAVFGDITHRAPEDRNVLRRLFLDPSRRSFYTDWPCAAAATLAQFRADSAPHIDDPWFTALIEEISARSPDFRRLWARHDVKGNADGLKDFQHPTAGRMIMEHLILRVPDAPHLRIIVYNALPDWDTPEKLRRLLAAD